MAKALKIFETINDRGVGLDAMDLLKNLLFMNVSPKDFAELRDVWKALTDAIYNAPEKPLRFLRYFLLANYVRDTRLQEATIYDWFQSNENLTKHSRNPIVFANELLLAAKAYANAVNGRNPQGFEEPGIWNTRSLGGSAVRQHFILLLAGRALSPNLFSRLADQIEELMFVFLITSTPTNEYERYIVDGAGRLKAVYDSTSFDRYVSEFFDATKFSLTERFDTVMQTLSLGNMRRFRIRYMLAKLTRDFDLRAYGAAAALNEYVRSENDVEHILPESPSAVAAAEFGQVGK